MKVALMRVWAARWIDDDKIRETYIYIYIRQIYYDGDWCMCVL